MVISTLSYFTPLPKQKKKKRKLRCVRLQPFCHTDDIVITPNHRDRMLKVINLDSCFVLCFDIVQLSCFCTGVSETKKGYKSEKPGVIHGMLPFITPRWTFSMRANGVSTCSGNGAAMSRGNSQSRRTARIKSPSTSTSSVRIDAADDRASIVDPRICNTRGLDGVSSVNFKENKCRRQHSARKRLPLYPIMAEMR